MSLKSIVKRIYWSLIQTHFFDKFRTRLLHIQFYILEGKTTRTNSDLSILVLANEHIVNYISELAYSEKVKIKTYGTTTFHNIESTVANTKPDIVLADISGIFSEFFSKTSIIMPHIISTLDISAPWKTIYAKMKRIRKRNIRKIEKLPYTYEVTNEPHKLHYFYHKMYLPFISKRPPRISGFTSIVSAEEIFSNGGLLLVKSNGKYVSGILYYIVNGTIHSALLAYKNGIDGQAALYFLIQWAKKNKCTKIDYGTTPPFMNDGLYLYKRSWGMKINANPKRMIAIKFCNFEKAVQDFLYANPFVFTDFKVLSGLILLDKKDADPRSLYHKYCIPGLNNLLVFYPTKSGNTCQIPISEDTSASVCDAINSLVKLALEKNFTTQSIFPNED